jgi:PAS domain S-box-containing protein
MVVTFTCRDGCQSWLNVSATPIVGSDDQLEGVVATLVDITKLKRAEERIEHLNLVLRAIRNVNRIITKEKERDRLLQAACNDLIKTRGYHDAWIALFRESGSLVTTAQAGLGESFLPIAERFKRGELTECARNALSRSEVVVTTDSTTTCAGCPLFFKCSRRGEMTVRLEYRGRVYGLLSVSIPTDFALDEEEQELFREVADDIALALHGLKLEEEQKQAENELRKSEEKLRNLLHGSPIPTYVIDKHHKVTHWNWAMEVYTGIKARHIVGTDSHWKAFYSQKRPCMADLIVDEKTDDMPKWYAGKYRASDLIEGAYEAEDYFSRLGKWLYFTAAPLTDHEGNLIGAVETNQDITEIKEAERQIKRLSGEVIRIEERERESLSREIHDNIGQLLFTLKMGLSRVSKKMPKKLSALKDQLSELSYLLNRTIKEIRGLSHALHPPLIEDLGLIPALEGLCQDFRSYSEIKIKCSFKEIQESREPIITITLYRFFQEGLNNILKHSQATEAYLSLASSNRGDITAVIEDNGIGFVLDDALSPQRNTKTLGLVSMRERLALIGGELEVRSSPGQGTKITAQLRRR